MNMYGKLGLLSGNANLSFYLISLLAPIRDAGANP